MTKLRFIKAHGDKQAGDIQMTESATTVHWLVDVYKVAVIDVPTVTAKPVVPVTDVTAPKAIPKAPRDKMARSSFNKTKRY